MKTIRRVQKILKKDLVQIQELEARYQVLKQQSFKRVTETSWDTLANQRNMLQGLAELKFQIDWYYAYRAYACKNYLC